MPRNVDLTFRQRKQTALPLPRTRPAFSGLPPPQDRAGPDNQQAQRSSPMHVPQAWPLLSWRQPANDANRLRVGGVLLRSPGAPSDSGMQRVPFCLKEPKCNLLAPAGNSENWANMLSWHSARNKNIQRRDFMLLQPRNSTSKVLDGGNKGLLKPENLRKNAFQDPGRARLHKQRQCNPEKAEVHTWPLPTAGTVASQACQPRLLVLVCIIAIAV